LEAKERVIQDLLLERRAWRTSAFLFWPLHRIVLWALKKKKTFTRVRLGELRQHPPRPFHFHFRIYPRSADKLPTISLVTPSYNQARFLRASLPGVILQGYPQLEYVVQDGGSSDESREVILEHAAGLHSWVSEPDGGQARGINLGFQKTSGEIMGWLNADDLHVPNTLWQVGEFFLTHPQVDVVYGHRLIINEDGYLIGSWIMPSHDDEVLSWADYIPQETLFWRRSVWERAGGRLDEDFHFALDWDLILRFRSAGARFHRIPKVLGCFRVHENQKTSLELGDRGRREMDLLRAKIHGKFPSDEEIWNQIKSYLRKSVYSHSHWDVNNLWKRVVYRKPQGSISL
jgi:glycosyltransferase involved in cell wall biosynthesis